MSARGPRLVWAAGAAAALALASACFSEHQATGPSSGPVSFAADVEPVLNSSCAFSGCHSSSNANPGDKPMVLATGQSYANIVGVASAELPSMQRIRAGQPDQSYLIHKLQGTHRTVGGSGDRMPLTGGPLSAATIDRIRRWVAAGALRN